MVQVNRILFPTDFSENAESAFTHALRLAEHFGATIHVLNVAQSLSRGPSGAMSYLDLENENDGSWSDTYNARERNIPIVHAQVRAWTSATGILEYAARHGADLIVMGMHGRHGMSRWFIGSTAEEVVRLASCPVFTVNREAALSRASVKRILVPIDFSDSAQKSAAVAKQLARAYGAELDVLHVVDDVTRLPIHHAVPVPLFLADILHDISEAVSDLVRRSPGEDVEFHVHIVADHPAHGILDFASANGTDMIVLTTHGRRGVAQLLAGGTTEKVVQIAPCPVFTAKWCSNPIQADDQTKPDLVDRAVCVI